MIKHLLFDFDGVIINSMPIREAGFRELFQDQPSEQVEKLVAFHRQNGGLSRFVKIRYFLESVLGVRTTGEDVKAFANRFSSIVKERLCDRGLLIDTTMQFISTRQERYHFHVVSGSEENELREVCARLGIAGYFRSIHGSPVPKNDLVASVIGSNRYRSVESALVGDSANDLDAARCNGIFFIGFNNEALEGVSDVYARCFDADFENRLAVMNKKND